MEVDFSEEQCYKFTNEEYQKIADFFLTIDVDLKRQVLDDNNLPIYAFKFLFFPRFFYEKDDNEINNIGFNNRLNLVMKFLNCPLDKSPESLEMIKISVAFSDYRVYARKGFEDEEIEKFSQKYNFPEKTKKFNKILRDIFYPRATVQKVNLYFD
jgi:hypothetical protein